MRAVVFGFFKRTTTALKRLGLYSQLFIRSLRDFSERRELSSTVATMLLTLGYIFAGMNDAAAVTCDCTCCSDNQENTQREGQKRVRKEQSVLIDERRKG
jgi:hypothetical protein